MKLFRDVVYQIGKEQGCSPICSKVIDFDGVVMLAKGKSAPTQNVNQAPWSDQAPYLREIFHNTQHNYNRQAGGQFFPGQTYANFSPQTENALNMTEQRAMAGSPVQNMANQELMKTLGGDYLYGGPGFDAAFQAASNRITPMVQSGFNRGGRLDSGLARQAETQALADAFASQYGDERKNQLSAMLFAPEAAQADYNDLARLAGVGEAREGQTQSGIDEAIARHDFGQNYPFELLAKYHGLVSGTYGADKTTTGFKGNKGAGILGSALLGAKAGSGAGPWGTAIGAGVGALGGAFL